MQTALQVGFVCALIALYAIALLPFIAKQFGKRNPLPWWLCVFLAMFPCGNISAGQVTVYNGSGNNYQSFARYVNGAYQNSPTEWNYLSAGARGTITEADGNLIQARNTGLGAVYAYPQAGVTVTANGNHLFVFFGTNSCVTFTNTITFQNNSPLRKFMIPYNNGTPAESRAFWIEPGATKIIAVDIVACTNGYFSNWTFEDYTSQIVQTPSTNGGYGFTTFNITNTWVNTGSGMSNASFPTSTVALTNATALWSNQTNSFINFTGTGTGAARDDTLKAGFNVLAGQLRSIGNQMDTLTAATLQGSGGSGGSGTNDINVSVTVTNVGGSNYPAYYSDAWQGFTNMNTITNAATASATALRNGLEEATNGFGITSGTPVAPTYTINFMGNDVDFNPFTRWPVIGEVSKWAWGTCAIIVFMCWLGKTIQRDVVAEFSKMQTGGVPNMSMEGTILGVGGGGNFLGMAIAAIVPVIFVSMMVAGVLALVSWGLGHVTSYFSSMDGSSLPGTFWYIADQLIPVALVVSLGIARVVGNFVVAAGIAAASSVVRFLPGK